MTYHTRIITLTYNDASVPTFETQAEIDEWHRALGRMVAYGLRTAPTDESVIEWVPMAFGTRPTEIDAAYHAPIISQPIKYEDGGARYLGSPAAKLDGFANELKNLTDGRRPFVMGAVLHGDGKWGFHS